jgi:tetratricopeptide (TPR) repeat protein
MSRLDQLLTYYDEDPTDSFIQFALAAEYRKLGRLQDAIDTFERLKKTAAKYVGLYYHLGKLNEEMNQLERAVEVYREGIEIASQVSDLHARAELQSALLEAEMSADL